MPENNETPIPAAFESGKDSVGDILRKERLTRRITVETIAKDLKLNVGYIKALEASDYEALPADPYVRVYIKSLTKYLSLDAEAIMKEFYKERGLIAEDREGMEKIDVSVKKQDKSPAIIIAAALIVALAVFAFIANQKGWISTENVITTTVAEERNDPVEDTAPAAVEVSEDSVLAAMNDPDSAAAATKQAPRP